jgi:translation initiation factor 2 beta subunit (eIF-2beta)/eIF-5
MYLVGYNIIRYINYLMNLKKGNFAYIRRKYKPKGCWKRKYKANPEKRFQISISRQAAKSSKLHIQELEAHMRDEQTWQRETREKSRERERERGKYFKFLRKYLNLQWKECEEQVDDYVHTV